MDRIAVNFAAREIAAHPAATLRGEPKFHEDGATLWVSIALDYGALWTARGESPTGVRPVEEVRFDFPTDFPAKPPEFSLRSDFSRNHPHIQPRLAVDGRVVPCVNNGPVGEFLAARGFHDLVDQILDWLLDASENRLMNLAQGWEPARRDSFADVLAADHDRLVTLVDRSGGFRFFRTTYVCRWSTGFTPYFWGELGNEDTVKAPLGERRFGADTEFGRGEGLAVAVWPGKTSSGAPMVCDTYLPDDITTVAGLLERARLYGLDGSLSAAISVIRKHAARRVPVTFPLTVILMARRPARVIGTTSDIEVCSYLTPNILPAGAMTDPAAPVRPLAHRDAMAPGLLRQMSGDRATPPWALLGCGSLGSKVAMHAGRSGNAPEVVADRAYLAPHNAARHALYPAGDGLAAGWLSPKARALADGLTGFRKPVRAVNDDHVALTRDLAAIKARTARPRWLVNTTASVVVRESLGTPAFAALPRIVEMSLFDRGQTGYVGIEGPNRNPDTVELIAALYQHASQDDDLRASILATETVARVAVGQGCGSLTMVASDATISVQAAVMAELFTGLDERALGAVHIFRRHGLATSHSALAAPAFHRVPVEGLEGWTLSIDGPVHDRIAKEKARHPREETGGILIGWSSSLARRMVVTDLIPAPPDSRRLAAEFVLGTEGLTDEIAALQARAGGLLRCLGTWHSHLGDARPSATDRRSAAIAGANDALPLAFLISGADGLRAVSAAPGPQGAATSNGIL